MKIYLKILSIASLSAFLVILGLLALTNSANAQTVEKIEYFILSRKTNSTFLGTAPQNKTILESRVELPQELFKELRKENISADSAVIKNKKINLDQYVNNTVSLSAPKNKTGKQAYKKLIQFIESEVVRHIEQIEKKDAVWKEENGRVVEFSPNQDGQKYDLYRTVKETIEAINQGRGNITVAAVQLPSEKRLSDFNQHGIKELIATGVSDFSGSSRARIQNIKVGMSRYQGVIVKPGETFSFNKLLGPVDGEHGFAPELVIKSNGLVPEFGGGICQVSTTVFRAAALSGLPIVERRSHSLAVSYYAPQGTDATIYPGVQDFKFANDTANGILIWPEIIGSKLYFNFYGTKDGREVELQEPYRYGHKTTGAFSAAFSRTVKLADGTSKEDVFRSYYRPKQEFVQTNTTAEPPKTDPPASEEAAETENENLNNNQET